MAPSRRKHGVFLGIAIAFLLAFMLVRHFSVSRLSDAPLVLHGKNPPEILMFGTRSCPYCADARAFFARHHLTYTEKDIEQSDKARDMFIMLGGRGTPLIIVNGVVIHGWDEQVLRENL